MKPQPRPALKRAEDADLHPALSVAPTQLPTQLARDSAVAERLDPPAAVKPPAPEKPRRKKFRSAGRATSDSLRGKPDKGAKPVTLEVKVPKRVRTEVRSIAKHSGTSVDAIVAQALVEWLGDPRRW